MKSFLSFFALINFSFGLIAQIPEDLPFKPDPNKCYVRYLQPATFDKVEKEYEARPAYTKLELVPAEFKRVETEIMIKEPVKDYIYTPPQYETVLESITVKDAYTNYKIIPVEFTEIVDRIEVREESGRWEYQNPNALKAANYSTMRYVKDPKRINLVNKKILIAEEEAALEYVDSETIAIKKKRVVKPAEIKEITHPGEYKKIKKDILVKDASIEEVEVPALIKSITIEVLKDKGGSPIWEEIECRFLDFQRLPIYYEFGNDQLNESSKNILQKEVFKLLTDKPYLSIEFATHTDSRGTSGRNMLLSQRRAQTLIDYLIELGIDKKRLKANAFGESRLINECKNGILCSEEKHMENRRVEYKVLVN